MPDFRVPTYSAEYYRLSSRKHTHLLSFTLKPKATMSEYLNIVKFCGIFFSMPATGPFLKCGEDLSCKITKVTEKKKIYIMLILSLRYHECNGIVHNEVHC